MRTKTIVIAGALLLAIILFSIPFINKQRGGIIKDLPPGTHAVTIEEVIQTSNYTYFRVEEKENEFWIAVTKREAHKGDVVYYTNPLEMNNFVSKELGRSFPVIYFVQNISDKPLSIGNPNPVAMQAKKNEAPKLKNISVNRIKGGITISELYEHQGQYAGKTVNIRGVVAKYNTMVMGRNWVHIQDGTDYAGQFDLAVTTMDIVGVGSTVTFTGIIHLKKDFGAGYFYPVIMEEAKARDIKTVE